MVGPFAFLDEMGPIEIKAGTTGDVPPHPHIGLSTLTYLFEGELTHRDSMGVVQQIVPGDVNWMTAGSGVAHSERISSELREKGVRLHGLQTWVALPMECEEMAPNFSHFSSEVLPVFEAEGVKCRVIAGDAFGKVSPVKTYSKLFFVDICVFRSMRPGVSVHSARLSERSDATV